MTFNKDIAFSYYQEEQSITEAAKRHCEELGIPYEPRYRHQVSRLVNKKPTDQDLENTTETDTNQYDMGENPMSAMKVDGTVMSIDEYCDHYGIPKEHVKSYKLVNHTGVSRYNIASHSLQGDHFETFYRKLLQEIAEIPNLPKTVRRVNTDQLKEEYLLVIDPADIHVGKLAQAFETGEEYNSNIAVQRTLEGVRGILEKSKGFPIDKILFIAGNDILHIDSPKRTTTSGTPQDTDGSWYSNFLLAKQLYIDILSILMGVADVHVSFNPSNHDWTHGFFLLDVVKTYFSKVENITFDSDLKHRKYFTYHNNLIGSTHGDGCKPADLGPLMADEAEDWGKCKHRYFYTHHVHHKTAKDYIGLTVESLRSPSGTDGWHHRNGYTGVPKAIEGFIHHKTQGQVARLTHIF